MDRVYAVPSGTDYLNRRKVGSRSRCRIRISL